MWFTTAFAATGLLLAPYGAVSDLGNGKPWYGFDSQDPLLNVVRIQKIQAPTQAICEGAVKAVTHLSFGVEFNSYAAWTPWAEHDLDAVKDCDDFPCKVKLSQAEVTKMSKAVEDKRLETFLSLVTDRADRYRKTQVRAEYEFPGDPVDPWKWHVAHGFVSTPKQGSPILWIRKLDLNPDKMRPIRQVLDVRQVVTKLSATVSVRDVYTAHYFDSWGEWHQVSCDPQTHIVTVIQSLFVELDLMKSHSLISRLGRGKMRTGVKENGSKYLDAQFLKMDLIP